MADFSSQAAPLGPDFSAQAEPQSLGMSALKAVPRGMIENATSALVPFSVSHQQAQDRLKGYSKALPTLGGMDDAQFQTFVRDIQRSDMAWSWKSLLTGTARDVRAGRIAPTDVPDFVNKIIGSENVPEEVIKSVRQWTAKELNIPADDEKKFAVKFGRGVGSMLGFLLSRVATGPAGVAAYAGLSGAGRAAEEAKYADATYEQIAKAQALGGIVGLTDMVPIEAAVSSFAIVPGLKAAAWHAVQFMVKQGLIEGTQEGVQTALENAVAKFVHTPSREITEGVGEAGLLGFAVGALMGGVTGGAGYRAVQIEQPDITNVPPPPAPEALATNKPAAAPAPTEATTVEGLTEQRMAAPLYEKVVRAADELLTQGKVTRDPNRLISDQIFELLQTERLQPEAVQEVMAKHNVSADEFANLWRVTNVRVAARQLGMLGAVEAKLKKLSGQSLNEGEMEMLRRGGLDEQARGMAWWRRVSNVWRGALVTQLATAMRNAETQVGRIGVDVLQHGMDKMLARMFGGGKATPDPVSAFAPVVRMFSRGNKQMVEDILSRFPKQHDRLFFRYSSDVNAGVLGFPEKAVHILNAANRFQEYAVRRSVFAAELDRLLGARGHRLDDIVAKNQVGAIPQDMIEDAVNKALELTFAKDFDPFGQGYDRVAGNVIKAVNNVPGAHIGFPFPRFFFNALKFQFEFSPMGVLKLLSQSERARVASGDFAVISRATIGTAMLLAAYAVRESDYAGERWYEARLPDGRTLDLRPFNPFASYFFIADVIKRSRDGTLYQLTSKDITMGLFATQYRAGAGLAVVDAILGGVVGTGDAEKGLRLVQQVGGEYAGGFFTAVQQVKDVVAQFDESERIVRDRKANPFMGPIYAHFPYAEQAMGVPDVELPTREGPLVRQEPLLRQLTGANINQEKNALEKELDRLGFSRKEYFGSTGHPEADRLVAKYMGALVERTVLPFAASVRYEKMPDTMKAFALQKSLREARRVAMNQAIKDNPPLFAKLWTKSKGLREEMLINEMLGRPMDEIMMERQNELR